MEDYENEIKEREKTKPDVEPLPTKSAIKTTKNASKASSNVQSKGKNNKNVKFQQQQQQQKSTQQQTTKGNAKGKIVEELKVEKDHFKKDSESSTSDESWEKEFDM